MRESRAGAEAPGGGGKSPTLSASPALVPHSALLQAVQQQVPLVQPLSAGSSKYGSAEILDFASANLLRQWSNRSPVTG